MTNFQTFKCRCSSIHKLLANGTGAQQITDKQEEELKRLQDRPSPTDNQKQEIERLLALKANKGKIVLGATAIEYLMEVYSLMTEGMISVGKESLDSLAIRKGKEGEAIAGRILSLVDNVEYKTHKERIENDYLSGEIDLYAGTTVYEAHTIADIKNSEDYPAFLKKLHTGLENGHREQLQGYGDITGASDLFIAHTLVSFTPEMIEDMKWKVLRKVNAVTEESPEFLKVWQKFEHSMNFDKIPIHKRVFKKKVDPFTQKEQQNLYDRVKYCRDWLENFHEEHENRNL
jgi:predicted nucleotidyltransferase